MPPRDPWPQVVLALGLGLILVSGAVILLAMDKSVSEILTLGALVAGPALAWFATNTNQKLEQVKEISNGNLHRKDSQNEAQVAQLVTLTSQLLAMVAQTHPGIPKEVSDKLMPLNPGSLSASGGPVVDLMTLSAR